MRKSLVISVVFVFLLFSSLSSGIINAVEVTPSKEQIENAVQLGIRYKDKPEKLFEPYEFGKRGVETNGYVMTKLFQISQKAADLRRKNKAIEPGCFDDILKQNYLLFPLYLVAASEKGLENVSVELRQGMKTIKSAELIKDPVKKAMCKDDLCLFKRDVYAGFYYSDFDAQRLVVLVIKTGKKVEEFPLSFSVIK